MAYNSSNNLWWYDKVNSSYFCYDSINRFEIFDNQSPSCPGSKDFFDESHGYTNQIYSRSISCLNVTTSDGAIQLSANISDLRLNPRSKDTANYNWSQGTLLFDFYSDKISNPATESGNSSYTIFISIKKTR